MTDSRYLDRLIRIISEMPEEEQEKLLDKLESKVSKKERKHPRKECLITVNYAVKGRAYQNCIQDISIEGVFIETRERFSVGAELLLTISYSNQIRPFKITGEVVRIESNGVGVKFKKLSQVQEEVIKSIVNKARGQ